VTTTFFLVRHAAHDRLEAGIERMNEQHEPEDYQFKPFSAFVLMLSSLPL
jgi:hypothetical protein